MHFVAALDAVPEMRGVLALFEGVATGAADGYGRMADKPGGHVAAPRARARQRVGEPAQRPQGSHGDRQHRRRSRDVPQEVRRATRVRHRDGGPQRVVMDPPVGVVGAVGLDAAEAVAVARNGQVATLILPADASWSEGGEPAPPIPGRETHATRHRAAGRRRPPSRRQGAAREVPRRRGEDRLQAARRDVPDAAAARRGHPAGRTARVPRRVRGDATRGHQASGARRCEVARVVLRLSRQGQRSRAGGLRGARPRPGRCWSTSPTRRPRSRCSPRSDQIAPRARSRPRPWPPRSAR